MPDAGGCTAGGENDTHRVNKCCKKYIFIYQIVGGEIRTLYKRGRYSVRDLKVPVSFWPFVEILNVCVAVKISLEILIY